MIVGFEGERTVQKLEDIIKNNASVDSVYQHSAFNAGQPPAALMPKKKSAFQDKDDQFKLLMKALVQQTEFSMLWVVEVKGNKISPISVGLVVQKQITLSKGERYSGA